MSRIWIILWTTLVGAHVVTFWLLRPAPEPSALPDMPASRELISLADLTRQTWARLMPEWEPAGMPPVNSPEEELLLREALLLELRDREAGFALRGREIHLAADIVNWLSAERAQAPGQGSRVNRYLQDLLGWMDSFEAEDPACHLERLLLYPETASTLPAVSFEITGRPAVMGRGLLALETAGGPWTLRELDLVRSENPNNWWLRGSFVFEMEGAP